jgi:tetratricopeptide (TPR) repeat protein
MSTIIEKYIKEELSSAESEKVEAALIKEMFVQEQKAAWKKRIAQERQSPLSIIWRKPAISSAIAAMLLLGIALFIYQKNSTQSVEALVELQIKDGFDAPSPRMGDETREEIWAKAKEAFKNKQYDSAAAYIAQINPKTTQQSFYLGLSYMFSSQPNYELAVQQLELTQQANKDHVRESQWFLALCYLKQGNKDKAKNILTQFVSKGNWKTEEAKALLAKL